MMNVSVIIPAYNSARYLPKTIESVLSQDYDDIEIIIVDDKSTDNTREVISEIKSDKLRYVCLEKNHGGPSRPRNIGIREAKGEFIVFCDSDDIFVKDRIRMAVEFLKKFPELGLVFTDEEKIEDETDCVLGNFLTNYSLFNALPKKKVASTNYIITSDDAYNCLFYENYIMPSGVTLPKSIFKEIGYFDETLTNGDDRDMWFRITQKYPIGFINEIGFKYRIRRGSISGRGASLYLNRIKVMEKQLVLSSSSRLKKRCYELIAMNNYSIGYCYQADGEFKKSRFYYYQSLKAHLNWNAIKGFMITCINADIFFWLKKMLGRLKR